MASIKKFLVQFSHFVTGSVLSIILGLISFPILTRILTEEEYGIIGLISTTMLLATAIAKCGLSNGIIRFYESYSNPEEKRVLFVSSVMISGLSFSILTVLAYIAIIPDIFGWLEIKEEFLFSFTLMSAYLFIRPLNIIVFNLLRVNEKTFMFNVVNFIGRITAIGLSLFIVLCIIRAVYGYFIGVLLAEYIVSLILFWWFFTHYELNLKKFSLNLTLSLATFGIPLVFDELSYLLLTYADRYMIAYYYGEDFLGIYTVGYNLAMYLANIIYFSLSYTITPMYVQIFAREGKENTEAFLQKCSYYLLVAFIPMCFGYYAISKDLFIVLASEKYSSCARFSPLILLGTVLLAMNTILNAGLYLKKKSLVILFIMITSVTLNILLNFILLPIYDITGSAIATLIASIFSVILTISISCRHIAAIKMNICKKLFFHLLLSTIMVFLVNQIEMITPWLNLACKTVLGLIIILSGIFIKEHEIRQKLVGIISKKP